MRHLTTVLIVSAVVLAGCGRMGESRLNPMNWFGKSKSAPRAEQTTDETQVNPLIPERQSVFRRDPLADDYEGTPVERVTDLVIERTASGAIVRATGVTSRQGAHDVRLTSQTEGEPVDGVLTFTLEAVQPDRQWAGAESQRTVTAGRAVSRATLESVRRVRVLGVSNARTSSR